MTPPRVRSSAVRFIVCLGLVSLFADMTYEGARSVIGPFLQNLGVAPAILSPVGCPGWEDRRRYCTARAIRRYSSSEGRRRKRPNCHNLRGAVADQAMQVQLTKQEVIEEMTRRLVDFYRAVRIYLFGSEARGEAGPDSDLDFLVVVSDDTPEAMMRTNEGYSRLSGLGMSKDVIPWRQSDFEARAAYVVASLPATVVREGRLLYESA
jgi:predicted nucleotidyltransferase